MFGGLFSKLFKRRKKVRHPQSLPKVAAQTIYEQPTKPVSVRTVAEKAQYRSLHSGETEAVLIPKMRPKLPLDEENRPFIKIRNPYEPTLLLLTAAVGSFCKCEQDYPEEIRLTGVRYFKQPGRVYSTAYGRVKIQCVCDNDMDCDVLIRGKQKGVR